MPEELFDGYGGEVAGGVAKEFIEGGRERELFLFDEFEDRRSGDRFGNGPDIEQARLGGDRVEVLAFEAISPRDDGLVTHADDNRAPESPEFCLVDYCLDFFSESAGCHRVLRDSDAWGYTQREGNEALKNLGYHCLIVLE